MINTYFDKIFYINLDKDVDRNEHILFQLAKFNITNIERVSGVVYHDVPDESLWRNFNIKEKRYVLSSLGCRDSHLSIIKIAKERGYKRILILEDDIVFLQDPNELLRRNEAIINDWDMLYFSGLVEHFFRNQIVGGYAYGISHKLYDDMINMAIPSGMEMDNFYAKIIQHASYNYNQSGKYNIRMIEPFNSIIVSDKFKSNIR